MPRPSCLMRWLKLPPYRLSRLRWLPLCRRSLRLRLLQRLLRRRLRSLRQRWIRCRLRSSRQRQRRREQRRCRWRNAFSQEGKRMTCGRSEYACCSRACFVVRKIACENVQKCQLIEQKTILLLSVPWSDMIIESIANQGSQISLYRLPLPGSLFGPQCSSRRGDRLHE